MSYSEYKNSGRTLGKILYQLRHIGVPLHIVEQVVMDGNNQLKYFDTPFCTYKWNEQDTPIFKFSGFAADVYSQLLQEPIYILYVSTDHGVTYVEHSCFTYRNTYEAPRWLLSHSHRIFNGDGEQLDSQLKPIAKASMNIGQQYDLLKSKFCKH